MQVGAKLVRGAYMQLERARARERGYESPICDTIEDTHANYDRCAVMGSSHGRQQGHLSREVFSWGRLLPRGAK